MSRLDSAFRWPAAALMIVTAAVHIPLIREHLEEAPYLGVLFIALSAACILLAAAVLTMDTPVTWSAVGLVSVLALAGFLASRTVGLPEVGDDVGNWSDPLGYPAMVAETLAAVLATVVLTRSRRARA